MVRFRPKYKECRFNLDDVNAAMELAARGVVCANWLAATARKEAQRFKEFIVWVKYGAPSSLSLSYTCLNNICAILVDGTESQRATNLHNESYTPPPPKHDILDVNAYLTSGLVVSTIDKWFMGPVPRFPLVPGFGVTLTPSSAGGSVGEVQMDDASDGGGKTARLVGAMQRARAKLKEGRHAFVWPPVRSFLSSLSLHLLSRRDVA